MSFEIRIFVLIFSFFSCYPTIALEIYGHRGAAGLAPENTLEAYRTALDLGVDYVDMDIGLTQDHVLVVYHDRRLNPDITRNENGEWLKEEGPALKHLSYKSLLTLDVGQINPRSEYAKQFPYQISFNQTKIPTVQEVIRYVKQRNPHTKFQIEIKSDPFDEAHSPDPAVLVPLLVQLLRDEGVTAHTEVHSFDWRNLQLLQKLAPEVSASYITERELFEKENGHGWMAGHRFTKALDSYPKLIHKLGGKVWCPYYGDLSKALIQEAHALGLKVTTWSVDDPQAMLRLMEWGVDGIITNRPDILRGLMVARKIGPPKNHCLNQA